MECSHSTSQHYNSEMSLFTQVALRLTQQAYMRLVYCALSQCWKSVYMDDGKGGDMPLARVTMHLLIVVVERKCPLLLRVGYIIESDGQ